MSQSLQVIEPHEPNLQPSLAYISPVISLERALANHEMLSQYVSKLLREGHDFGSIPGTGGKATLLKPGAEKLTTIFGLTKRFAIVETTEDWDGSQHNGEPFFYYLYRCSLWKGDILIAESDGSCNSFESKYRYRKGERICPECAQATIIKGKPEYGGGWICFGKKGGCGAKFEADDETITAQEVGRVINPDIADQVNTIQKMAQKRALIGTTLLAVNASEFFTQDSEDFDPPPSGTEGHERRQPAPPNEQRGTRPPPKHAPANPVTQSLNDVCTPKQITKIRSMASVLEIDADVELKATMKIEARVEELTRRAASAFIDHLQTIMKADESPLVRRTGELPPTSSPTHTKPVGVPTPPLQPLAILALEEFKAALETVKPKLPGWRFREIVQEFVQVEQYQPGDELDAIERDRAPMIQKLNDEAVFFVEKEQRANQRKTSGTFWKRVAELQAGREFGMALVTKWTTADEINWASAQDELERSVLGQQAA